MTAEGSGSIHPFHLQLQMAAMETPSQAAVKMEVQTQPKQKLNLPGGVNSLDFLYKLATQRGLKAPEFKQVTEQGPAHMKTFVWHCSFNNLVAQGTGRSKKEAKVAAAKAIRDALDYDSLPPPPNFHASAERKRRKEDNNHLPQGNGKKKRGGMLGMGMGMGAGMGMGLGMYGAPMMPMGAPPFGGFGMGYGPQGFPQGCGFQGGPFNPYHPYSFSACGMGGPGFYGPMGASGEEGCDQLEMEGADPLNGNKREELEKRDFVGDDKNGDNNGPTREAFMDPDFGGFFDDLAAGPPTESNLPPGDRPFEKERGMMVAEYQSRMSRNYRSRLSKLDRYVIKKHKDIYPLEKELSFILQLVTNTEESIKKVAESINALENEPAKKISGMVRVGDLSKGLLLASDRTVNLILLCKHTPSLTLLRDIQKLIVEKLAEVVPDNKYQIHSFEEQAGFCIAAMPDSEDCKTGSIDDPENEPPYAVNVTLTSTSLRQPKGTAGQGDEQITVQDPLPTDKCLEALAELRHSKWFAVTAANMPSCVECIRIVKDLSNRDPDWTVLSDWAIELLVERALFTAWMPLNPAASLMRVMEVVSSGLLMPFGAGIKDPCEQGDVDVTENLTVQQREDITHSAQRYLRLMHFRQIYKVLGMNEEDFLDEAYRNKRRSEKSNGDKSEPGDVRLEHEDISTANTASLSSSSMQP